MKLSEIQSMTPAVLEAKSQDGVDNELMLSDESDDVANNSANHYMISNYESTARRRIVEVTVSLEGLALVATQRITEMTVSVYWPEPLIEKAIFQNVVPFLEQKGPENFVRPNVDTLATSYSVSDSIPIASWEGYEDAVESITYDTKKHEGISRIKRVETLLEKLNAAKTDLVVSNARLGTLQNTSAIPHGETGEMRFGSTAEIIQQQKNIQNILETTEKLNAELLRHITKINEALQVRAEDDGWNVQLPEMIDKITRMNNIDFEEQ